jgi:hypothetical protein
MKNLSNGTYAKIYVNFWILLIIRRKDHWGQEGCLSRSPIFLVCEYVQVYIYRNHPINDVTIIIRTIQFNWL